MKLEKKICIEIFWSAVVGMLFSMTPVMFSADKFSLRSWWRYIDRYDYEFAFGFILSMLVIYSIKKYNEENTSTNLKIKKIDSTIGTKGILLWGVLIIAIIYPFIGL